MKYKFDVTFADQNKYSAQVIIFCNQSCYSSTKTYFFFDFDQKSTQNRSTVA